MNASISGVRQHSERLYFATGYTQVRSLLSDRRVCADPAALGPHADFPQRNRRGVSMQSCDGEQHSRLRSIIAPSLTSTALDTLYSSTPNEATELLERMTTKGSGDLIEGYIAPLIRRRIGQLVGIPLADQRRVVDLAGASIMDESRQADNAAAELEDYVSRLIRTKQSAPGDDLCTALGLALGAGELTDEEAFGTGAFMIIAGTENNVRFLSVCLLMLLETPLWRQELLDMPASLPWAIEEVLRFISPATATAGRFVADSITIDGITIPSGSQLAFSLRAANHDASVFESPEICDPARDGARNLSFGYGPHMCPGAGSARRLSVAAVKALLPRMNTMELAIPFTEIEWHENRFGRRPARLPIRFVTS